MAEVLEGKPVYDLAGAKIGVEDGIMQITQQNQATLLEIAHNTNGGMIVKQVIRPEWTRGQKIAVASVGVTLLLGTAPSVWLTVEWLANIIAT